MHLTLDEDDDRAIQQAIAHLQTQRDANGCYGIPVSGSCLAGAALAEVCRSYLDARGEWPGREAR
jgi:hypothetical protein